MSKITNIYSEAIRLLNAVGIDGIRARLGQASPYPDAWTWERGGSFLVESISFDDMGDPEPEQALDSVTNRRSAQEQLLNQLNAVMNNIFPTPRDPARLLNPNEHFGTSQVLSQAPLARYYELGYGSRTAPILGSQAFWAPNWSIEEILWLLREAFLGQLKCRKPPQEPYKDAILVALIDPSVSASSVISPAYLNSDMSVTLKDPRQVEWAFSPLSSKADTYRMLRRALTFDYILKSEVDHVTCPINLFDHDLWLDPYEIVIDQIRDSYGNYQARNSIRISGELPAGTVVARLDKPDYDRLVTDRPAV